MGSFGKTKIYEETTGIMRSLEAIEKDLASAREALSHVEGMPAEVYSRIVGYYRSVRNWNRGKREEYGERRLFKIDPCGLILPEAEAQKAGPSPAEQKPRAFTAPPAGGPLEGAAGGEAPGVPETGAGGRGSPDGRSGKGRGTGRLLLFVRSSCPACPSAKAAAGRLGIPVDLVNADTAEGIAEAARRRVYATPTAILYNGAGEEMVRALDSREIAALRELAAV
jgi:ribonucleoside-triphosphate reductase